MIAKQIKGCNFKACLNYLLSREASKVIGGNMAGNSPESLAVEFSAHKPKSAKGKRCVYHTSLSLAPHEKLSEDEWKAIATDYLQGMGFKDNQYVLVAHNDTEHNHIHIVANRTTGNRTMVKDSWDFTRSEKLVRELEKKYDLEPTPGSREKLHRSATTGETRLRRRTGESSVREFIQGAIDSVCTTPQTMPEFITKVQEMGIETRITAKGGFRGISFKHEGIAFSGTHLGRGYTFPGLQKYRGVSYNKERDDALLFNTGGDKLGSNKRLEVDDGLPPIDGKYKALCESLQAIRAMKVISEQLVLKKKKELELG